MMNAIQKAKQTGALVALITICSAAHAQAPHSITYSQVSVDPGTIVVINGTQFVAVQVPVRQFTVDQRYAVRFLSNSFFPDVDGDFVTASISTTHSNDPLANQNATIDTFPAQIDVTDHRSYGVNTVIDPITFLPSNRLQVQAFATASVQVKLGDTLLSYLCFMSKIDHDVDLGFEQYRGTAQAAYGKYVDPVDLIGPSGGLDKCIDYLRIIPLN